MPKGVSIPPRLAAQFCRMNVSAVHFVWPVLSSTNQLRGRNVSSAVSLVSSMEPASVMDTSDVTAPRVVWNTCTSFCASRGNSPMPRRAPTTASTHSRQDSVFTS